MDTVLQGIEPLKDVLGSEGVTGLARTLAEACANEIMSAEADAVCEATGTVRNGYRERELETQFGTLTLRIPKLRAGSYFPESLIERWGRVDRAVICAASEMCALGVSTRKVGRALERMGAAGLSKDRVSRICAELDAEVAALRSRDLPDQRYPYLWVDATCVPCRKGGHGATAAVVTAIACGEDGARRVVGLGCVDTESYASWKPFLRGLRERGLDGVQCVTSDAHGGIVRAGRELFPGAAWQRCIARLERDVIDAVATRAKRRAAGAVLHAVFAETDPARVRAAYQPAVSVISGLSEDAGRTMEEAEADALAYLDFPEEHRRRTRTNNVQERCNREIKRRTRVVQSFPSEALLVRLVGAVLCEADEDWSSRRYIAPGSLEALWEPSRAAAPAAPDPEDAEVERQRMRLAVVAGLDGMGKAA